MALTRYWVRNRARISLGDLPWLTGPIHLDDLSATSSPTDVLLAVKAMPGAAATIDNTSTNPPITAYLSANVTFTLAANPNGTSAVADPSATGTVLIGAWRLQRTLVGLPSLTSAYSVLYDGPRDGCVSEVKRDPVPGIGLRVVAGLWITDPGLFFDTGIFPSSKNTAIVEWSVLWGHRS